MIQKPTLRQNKLEKDKEKECLHTFLLLKDLYTNLQSKSLHKDEDLKQIYTIKITEGVQKIEYKTSSRPLKQRFYKIVYTV